MSVLGGARVVQSVPALPGQHQPQCGPPVVALHQRLHLAGLHHTPELGPDLVKAIGDVGQVYPPAAVLHQDRPEAELLGVESSGGHTDVRGNPTDVNIRHGLVPDELLQASLAQLGVIEECAVGVNIWVDAFVHNSGFGVELEVLVQLGPPGVLDAVPAM